MFPYTGALWLCDSNEMHLKKLIKIFEITWKLQAGVFDLSQS